MADDTLRLEVEAAVDVAVLGAGGHAVELLDAIEAGATLTGGRRGVVRAVLADWDGHSTQGDTFGPLRRGPLADVATFDGVVVVGVGYPKARRAVCGQLADLAPAYSTVVHPFSSLSRSATLGSGTVVLAGAVIGAVVELGAHVMIGAGAIVGHGCRIGEFTSVMPGAVVSGDVQIGSGVLIGSGAVVLERLRIGDGAKIGAGTVVRADVEAGATVVGS